MKSSVALIGFMGVGKTVVGQILGAKLGKILVELDALIEKMAGKSIPEIFRHDGEIAFRELEIEAVKQVAGKKDVVIACGGGVVLNRINIDRLRQEAMIVLLTASPSVIMKRTTQDREGRPVLWGTKSLSDIQAILKFRKPYYEQAADIKVNTSKLEPEAVAEQIIARLKEYEGINKQKCNKGL